MGGDGATKLIGDGRQCVPPIPEDGFGVLQGPSEPTQGLRALFTNRDPPGPPTPNPSLLPLTCCSSALGCAVPGSLVAMVELGGRKL